MTQYRITAFGRGSGGGNRSDENYLLNAEFSVRSTRYGFWPETEPVRFAGSFATAARERSGTVSLWHAAERGVRLAYADPPYPGRAHLYADHPDYAGEVDHRELALTLATQYDGWALSTSAEALPSVFNCLEEAGVFDFRVLAWVKHTVTVSWEPVIVVSARKPEGVRDWIQVEPDSYQWRDKPDSYVVGQKPEVFCRWVFEWLGADVDDELDDLFPGSGNVGRAWDSWRSQPGLLTARSRQAEKRAGRRELAKADRPSLLAEEVS